MHLSERSSTDLAITPERVSGAFLTVVNETNAALGCMFQLMQLSRPKLGVPA